MVLGQVQELVVVRLVEEGALPVEVREVEGQGLVEVWEGLSEKELEPQAAIGW